MKKKHFESEKLVAPSKKVLSGRDAMGMPVPAHRLQKGCETIKEILKCDKDTAMSIAKRCANFIKKDECAYIIGEVSSKQTLQREKFNNTKHKAVDELIFQIDLFGRYWILAEMLTD